MASFAWPEHLDFAVNRRQGRSAADRIRIAQQNSVVRIARCFDHRSECFLGLLPGISIGRSVKIRYGCGARLRAQGSVKLATPAQSFGGGLLRFVERVGKPGLKI